MIFKSRFLITNYQLLITRVLLFGYCKSNWSLVISNLFIRRYKGAFLCCSIFMLAGCGFYSFTGASIAPDIKTISVQYFPNNASIVNPTLSQQFTDALKLEFQNQTSLTLVNSGGDLNFEGAITAYTLTSTASQSNETSGLTRLTVTINVKFTNNKDPDKSFEKSMSRDYSYESSLTLAQAETTYLPQIIDALVDDIFAASVANW